MDRFEWALTDEDLASAPAHTPEPVELADLQMLLAGAYAPLDGFMSRADCAAVEQHGRLPNDGVWPLITLLIPDVAVRPEAKAVVLTDPEGAPVGALHIAERWPARKPGHSYLSGAVRAYGDGGLPFHRYRLSAAEARHHLHAGQTEAPDRAGASRVLGFYADRPLHRPQLAQLLHTARQLSAQIVLLVPVAEPGPDGLEQHALLRCVLAAAERLPDPLVVAIPLHRREDQFADGALRARVAEAYGVTHLLSTAETIAGRGPRVLVPRALAYDTRDGQWRDANDVNPRFARLPLTPDEIAQLLDDGETLPEWHTPPGVARELAKARPPRRQRGLVLFFTGLSGSGKSTVAHGVAEVLREEGERSITMLDGDVVRRELSKGLGFGKEDRDLNIRRIGFVAAEVARHGGVAIACPIAPYAAARAVARAMARTAGADFILVHVATPLEVCEKRDRKGLYAKARAGLIRGMTGIDDPYEAPTDAELTIDTSQGSVEDAVDEVLDYLVNGSWISLPEA
ncbi:sulfate adenylyltransferase [Hamadaea flava]|uniref:Adenylyl-sulfate kinase n=1 Tax=Hamadaea flava TaxID=1742688 RepID=A0ABV8LHS9_9ACTN|nr:adenylyl-sulfate kinase [Hamadaea flava]MCP2326596.1 sulfate adenylyltransferase [Hamadaea flava]